MTRCVLVTCLLVLPVDIPSFGQEKPPVNRQPLDAGFLRQYAETRGFLLGRPVNPKLDPDGKSVLFLRSEARNGRRSLYEFEVATGKSRLLLRPEALLKGEAENLSPEEKARRERMRLTAGGFTDFHFDATGRYLLLPLSGKLFVYDRQANTSRELKTAAGTLIDPKWSPDGKWIAFVRDNDVFAYELTTDKERRITSGGSSKKTHGLAEFVAQEEMARFTGYWWSPDAKAIAFEEADHEGVEIWYVADPTKPDQPPAPQYYPRPGKKNVSVRLGIATIPAADAPPTAPVWVNWDRTKYEYLASVQWAKNGKLTIQVQDRKQQELLLLDVNPTTGKTSLLLTEKDPAFVNLRPTQPHWLLNNMFLWVSEAEDGLALQMHADDGRIFCKIVEPKEGMTGLVAVRNSTLDAFYTVAPDSTRSLIYRRSFAHLVPRRPDSGLAQRLGPDDGITTGVFADKVDAFVLTHTSLKQLPKSEVHTAEKLLGELPSVAEDPGFTPRVTIEKVGNEPGYFTAVVLPHNYDPKKRYPVLVDVYGGPHHLHVVRAMRNWLLPQWLADQGFIVVAIENRGTPARGRDWERSINQQFGSIPLTDQVAGLQALGKKYPSMDLERVGIVGWSFGGYMSALAVLKRPDVFKAAVAGAPVTDWEDYDTHYTERYMGLLPESKRFYDQSSLIPLAPKLERPLLLVHGTADDNVYFRHTLKLTDALFRAGKDFEVLPLPSLTHMVPDPIVTERLWTRIARHFQKHLGEPK